MVRFEGKKTVKRFVGKIINYKNEGTGVQFARKIVDSKLASTWRHFCGWRRPNRDDSSTSNHEQKKDNNFSLSWIEHETVQEVPQHGANQLREATSQESCVFITQCDDPTTVMSLSLLIDDSKDLYPTSQHKR